MWHILTLVLPALIPSWRFFDEIRPSPRIEFATFDAAGGIITDWVDARPRPLRVSLGRMVARLFWNPRWNEGLFLVSCAERILENPTTHSQTEIARRIARGLDGAPASVQFRIVLVKREGADIVKEVTTASPLLPLENL